MSSLQKPGFSLSEQVATTGASAHRFYADAKELSLELARTVDLKKRVEKRPYTVVIAAALTGYALGGGLFSSWTKTLARMGLRMALFPLLQEELSRMFLRSNSATGGGSETMGIPQSQSHNSAL